MKDKLEKTGHKKLYYDLKMFFTVFLFAVAILALAAIPVGVTYKLAEAQAEAEQSSTSQVVSSSAEQA
jgi:hypothetical protein